MKTEMMKKIEGFNRYYISKTGQILDIDYDRTKKKTQKYHLEICTITRRQ